MVFMFLGPSAVAQTAFSPAGSPQSDTLRGRVLGSAVVRAPKSMPNEIVPAQMLEGRQLQQLGGHSVADAVRFFSGVQVKDYGGVGGLKTVNVHGMGSEHVGVVYDGIPVDNAQNGQVDLGRFSLDNMESVALYAGGSADILKPARNFASSSSVYLQTRTPVFRQDSTGANGDARIKPYNLKGTFRTGSFGLANPSVRWEQRWNRRLSSSLSAEYLNSTGRYRYRYSLDGGYDTTATRRNGDVEAVRCEAALFGNMHGGYWRAHGYVYSSQRGLPGAVVRNRFSNAGRQWDLNTFLQASAKKDFGRYSLLLNAKYGYDYLRYLHDPREDDGTMYVDNRYRQQQVYMSVAQRYRVAGNWNVALSADYVMNALNADLKDFAKPVRHSFYGALATEWRTPRFSAQADVLLTHVDNHTRRAIGNNDADFTEVSPAVYASCRPFASCGLVLRAFYKKAFRMPTLNDLYYTYLGNSNLSPEYATQYDVGATYAQTFKSGVLRSVSLKADAYYNRVSDKIVAVPAANLFRWTMMNIGLARIHGLDATAQAEARMRELTLDVKVAYTYQRAKDCSDRQSRYYGGQIPYIPRHSVSVVAGAEWRGWALNYSFLYTGERYDASANIAANYIHPWQTHDASILRNIHAGKVELTAMLTVNNIFKSQYEVIRCYPMPGRNFKITVAANL